MITTSCRTSTRNHSAGHMHRENFMRRALIVMLRPGVSFIVGPLDHGPAESMLYLVRWAFIVMLRPGVSFIHDHVGSLDHGPTNSTLYLVRRALIAILRRRVSFSVWPHMISVSHYKGVEDRFRQILRRWTKNVRRRLRPRKTTLCRASTPTSGTGGDSSADLSLARKRTVTRISRPPAHTYSTWDSCTRKT